MDRSHGGFGMRSGYQCRGSAEIQEAKKKIDFVVTTNYYASNVLITKKQSPIPPGTR